MTARTIASPTNVRTRPPPLPPVAACDWSTDGRLSGVDSLPEAARADGEVSSMPRQAAGKAVVRVGNIEGERPGVREAGRRCHRRWAPVAWAKLPGSAGIGGGRGG